MPGGDGELAEWKRLPKPVAVEAMAQQAGRGWQEEVTAKAAA